jgi:hypothetical protein
LRRPEGEPNEISPSNIEFQNKRLHFTTAIRLDVFVAQRGSTRMPKELPVSSNIINSTRYSFEPETLRSVSTCQYTVRDVTVRLEPLLLLGTHGI